MHIFHVCALKRCSAPCSSSLGVLRAFSSAGAYRNDVPKASDNPTHIFKLP